MTTTPLAKLNPARKADRLKAAERLCEIARKHGFTTATTERSREVLVTISHPCGACASLWIDRGSKDQELVAWFTDTDTPWQYPPSFGNVNPHHNLKATHLYAWPILDAELNRHCRKIATLAKELAR